MWLHLQWSQVYTHKPALLQNYRGQRFHDRQGQLLNHTIVEKKLCYWTRCVYYLQSGHTRVWTEAQMSSKLTIIINNCNAGLIRYEISNWTCTCESYTKLFIWFISNIIIDHHSITPSLHGLSLWFKGHSYLCGLIVGISCEERNLQRQLSTGSVDKIGEVKLNDTNNLSCLSFN